MPKGNDVDNPIIESRTDVFVFTIIITCVLCFRFFFFFLSVRRPKDSFRSGLVCRRKSFLFFFFIFLFYFYINWMGKWKKKTKTFARRFVLFFDKINYFVYYDFFRNIRRLLCYGFFFFFIYYNHLFFIYIHKKRIKNVRRGLQIGFFTRRKKNLWRYVTDFFFSREFKFHTYPIRFRTICNNDENTKKIFRKPHRRSALLPS